MTATREAPFRSLRTASLSLVVVLALAACTPPDEPAATTTSPSPSASPSPSPSAEQTPLAIPEIEEGELARAEFHLEGPDGVPTTSITALGAITGDGVRVEGQCSGGSVEFELTTATPDEERRNLIEGIMMCGDRYASTLSGFDYRGLVQLSFTGTNDVDSGWMRAVPFTP
jgi:hypothetical protein